MARPVIPIYYHDPGEDNAIDYRINWSQWIGTDTIVTSTWTVPAGITKNSEENTTTEAVVWVTGGVVGNTYTLTNHIETAAGRKWDQSIKLRAIEL